MAKLPLSTQKKNIFFLVEELMTCDVCILFADISYWISLVSALLISYNLQI